jgi:hypothetical protein
MKYEKILYWEIEINKEDNWIEVWKTVDLAMKERMEK